MKKSTVILSLAACLASPCFSQTTFSGNKKKYIENNDSTSVFKNTLLIDGKGNPAKPNQTVIISNGKIIWVGDDAKAIVPKAAKIIDLNGKALMPGLVLLHEHMYISAFDLDTHLLNAHQLPVSFPRLYLACGATTIRTCGSIEPYSDLSIKKAIDQGLSPGPFIELTAPYIEGGASIFPQMNELKTPEEATVFVNYWADQGFTSFKAYMSVDKAILKAAIDAAHKRKLKTTGHLDKVTYKEAGSLGIDNLEHGFLDSTDLYQVKRKTRDLLMDQRILLWRILISIAIA